MSRAGGVFFSGGGQLLPWILVCEAMCENPFRLLIVAVVQEHNHYAWGYAHERAGPAVAVHPGANEGVFSPVANAELSDQGNDAERNQGVRDLFYFFLGFLHLIFSSGWVVGC